MNKHIVGDATPVEIPFKGIQWVENKSILTPTGGFLESGYTHTLNPYVGCAFAGALCGTFCYAQHQHWIVRGRPWGLYGAKHDIRQAYQRDFDRLKRPKRGDPRPLRIYMSSSTDPYLPQEQRLGLTRAILEEMHPRPPDVLVVQTHNILIRRDLDLIRALAERCELWVSITVETDMDPVPGFPPHASRPAARLETLKQFREAGVRTQAAISPLMPLANPQTFAQALEAACDRVIVDHYLVGDGTHGARTRRTNFIQLLEQAGFSEWTNIEKMWEVRDLLAHALGAERVLVSAEGFNAVGVKRVSTTGGNVMSVDPTINDAPPDLRDCAVRAARWFNSSETWIPLALLLAEIKEKTAYREWHFSSLAAFAEQELDLSKSVVSELLRSHQYLANRHPECLASGGSAAELPSYSTIAILARTSARLPEGTVDVLDHALFAGTIKRKALKELIRKELVSHETAATKHGRQDHLLSDDSLDILSLLAEVYVTFDLPALRDQLTAVFEGWDEATNIERHQVLGRLYTLIDRLMEMRPTVQARCDAESGN